LISELLEKAKDLLFVRQRNYQEAFNPNTPGGAAVLKDLARFCRAHETTFNADPRIHAVLEGRREVWLRIQHHLKLDSEKLWELYGEGKKI
jgi:hypothetical protein